MSRARAFKAESRQAEKRGSSRRDASVAATPASRPAAASESAGWRRSDELLRGRIRRAGAVCGAASRVRPWSLCPSPSPPSSYATSPPVFGFLSSRWGWCRADRMQAASPHATGGQGGGRRSRRACSSGARGARFATERREGAEAEGRIAAALLLPAGSASLYCRGRRDTSSRRLRR